MNIAPPTDSLWKFLMISSIVGIVSLVIYYNGIFRSLNENLSKINRLQKMSVVESIPLFKERDSLTEKAKNEKNLEEKNQLEIQRDQITAKIISGPIQKDLVDLFSKTDSEIKIVTGRSQDEYFMTLAMLGFFFFLGGFMWYFGYQKHQDKKAKLEMLMLKLQYESLKKENANQVVVTTPES